MRPRIIPFVFVCIALLPAPQVLAKTVLSEYLTPFYPASWAHSPPAGRNAALRYNYIGAAVSNKLLAVDYLHPARYGLVEVNAGRYLGASVTGYQLGVYYPLAHARAGYHGQGDSADGWYLQALAGTVDTSPDGDDTHKADYGAGAGISYLWLNSEYLGSVGAAVALKKTDETENGALKKVEPLLLLSARFTFGF